MSKVVRSIGRGIGKVVKGVAKAVKKVASSKIGKVIIAAAAIYFGGAALIGMMGTGGAAAAGGLSGMAGASANIGAAWGSLGTAGSALAAGEVGTAASAIGTGFSGGVASAAAPAATGALRAVAPATASAAPTAGSAMTLEQAVAALPPLGSAAPAAGKGLLATAMSSPYTAPALISGGTQLLGGTLSGIGQQKALREQREYEQQLAADQRARYNQNVGTRLWGEAPTTTAPFERPELPGPQPLMPGNYQTGPMALIDQQRQGLVGSRVAMYDPRTGQYV